MPYIMAGKEAISLHKVGKRKFQWRTAIQIGFFALIAALAALKWLGESGVFKRYCRRMCRCTRYAPSAAW